jgi:hypothetical protein
MFNPMWEVIPRLKVVDQTTLLWDLYLSGMWLGVNLRTDTKRDTCLKQIGLRVQDVLIGIGLIFSIVCWGGGRQHDPFVSLALLA